MNVVFCGAEEQVGGLTLVVRGRAIYAVIHSFEFLLKAATTLMLPNMLNLHCLTNNLTTVEPDLYNLDVIF